MGVVVRAQLGERDAVAELVPGWHEAVWSYVRHMLGREDLASCDVSQEVWLAVVRGLPRLKEPERFAAWLFTIARRSGRGTPTSRGSTWTRSPTRRIRWSTGSTYGGCSAGFL